MTSSRNLPARLIVLSIWAALGWAVIALAWGLAVRSQIIVFDGLYSFISVLLSLLSLLAFRAIRKGPSERFPFGKEVLEPLTIVVKAAAIAGLCVYALSGAVMDILAGGRDVDAGWALVYAVAATAGCGSIALYLRHKQRAAQSDLVRAETVQWLMDTVLSAGIMVGFVIAVTLERTGYEEVAAYIDPAMVALVCVAFLTMPIRLLTQGFREVLMMTAPSRIHERVHACAHAVERRYGFDESIVRVAKVGTLLDIEIDLVVGESTSARTVEALDEVRTELAECLGTLDYQQWLNISFTTDREWVS